MSKAFTKETDHENDDGDEPDALPGGEKNYVTPQGLKALRAEWHKLHYEERPPVVQTVSWAAGNGDRSENGDYIYGKKRLREIDRRVRYLLKRIDSAVVVDPKQQKHLDQIFFGATVGYRFLPDEWSGTAGACGGTEFNIQIVGMDEANLDAGKISWLSPIACALMKARVGDEVQVRTPAGVETLEVLSIKY